MQFHVDGIARHREKNRETYFRDDPRNSRSEIHCRLRTA